MVIQNYILNVVDHICIKKKKIYIFFYTYIYDPQHIYKKYII